MNYTIFMPQNLTDTFHAIVDTVSCIMHYGFDILADVFGYYCGIIGLKFQFYATNSLYSIYYHGFFVTLWRNRNQSVCRHNVNLEVHSILCPTLWNFDNFTNQWRGQVEKVLPWIRIIVTRYTFKVRLYLSWFVIGQSKASQVSRIWWGLTSFYGYRKKYYTIKNIRKWQRYFYYLFCLSSQ